MLISNIFESNNLLLILRLKHKFYQRLIKLSSDFYHSSTFWMSKFWEHSFNLFKIHDSLLKPQEVVPEQEIVAFLQKLGPRVTVRIEHSQLLQFLYLQLSFGFLLVELPCQEPQVLRSRHAPVDEQGHEFVVRHVITFNENYIINIFKLYIFLNLNILNFLKF